MKYMAVSIIDNLFSLLSFSGARFRCKTVVLKTYDIKLAL